MTQFLKPQITYSKCRDAIFYIQVTFRHLFTSILTNLYKNFVNGIQEGYQHFRQQYRRTQIRKGCPESRTPRSFFNFYYGSHPIFAFFFNQKWESLSHNWFKGLHKWEKRQISLVFQKILTKETRPFWGNKQSTSANLWSQTNEAQFLESKRTRLTA